MNFYCNMKYEKLLQAVQERLVEIIYHADLLKSDLVEPLGFANRSSVGRELTKTRTSFRSTLQIMVLTKNSRLHASYRGERFTVITNNINSLPDCEDVLAALRATNPLAKDVTWGQASLDMGFTSRMAAHWSFKKMTTPVIFFIQLLRLYPEIGGHLEVTTESGKTLRIEVV